jgi:hypothetical protein
MVIFPTKLLWHCPFKNPFVLDGRFSKFLSIKIDFLFSLSLPHWLTSKRGELYPGNLLGSF